MLVWAFMNTQTGRDGTRAPRNEAGTRLPRGHPAIASHRIASHILLVTANGLGSSPITQSHSVKISSEILSDFSVILNPLSRLGRLLDRPRLVASRRCSPLFLLSQASLPNFELASKRRKYACHTNSSSNIIMRSRRRRRGGEFNAKWGQRQLS